MDQYILQKHSLTKDKLNIPISFEHCAKFSEKLTEWESLIPKLGLTDADKAAIENDNRRFRSQCSACISKWRDKCGRNATYWNLAQRLYDAEALGYIDKLLEIYSTPVPPSDTTEVGGVTTAPRNEVTGVTTAPGNEETPISERIKKFKEDFENLVNMTLLELKQKKILGSKLKNKTQLNVTADIAQSGTPTARKPKDLLELELRCVS